VPIDIAGNTPKPRFRTVCKSYATPGFPEWRASPPSCLRRLKGNQAAAGIVQLARAFTVTKRDAGTICFLIVRSILRPNLLCFDDQAIDECLQVAI
jgi:hypothetical protein